MVSRPKSPTSLLWAHELKRQHEYLLQRQKDLETRNEDLQAAVTQAQTSAQAVKDQAFESAKLSTANTTIQEQASHIEALTGRVLVLEADKRKVNEDMDVGFGREKATLKRINDLEASQMGLSKTLKGLERRLDEIRTLGFDVHAARGRRGGPRSFTAWKDTSEAWSPDRENYSRERTLKALEWIGQPRPRGRSLSVEGTVIPEYIEQGRTSTDVLISSSPLVRKQRSISKQTIDTEKKLNYKKRSAEDTQCQDSQLRRSQRITYKPITFHALEEAIIDPGGGHVTSRVTPKPRVDQRSRNQSSKPRVVLTENNIAGNRGITGQLNPNQTPPSLKTAQLEASGLAQLPESESPFPLPDRPCTPIRSPGIHDEEGRGTQDPKTPQHPEGSMPTRRKDESPPWRVPKFILPDFLVPPDWYRLKQN